MQINIQKTHLKIDTQVVKTFLQNHRYPNYLSHTIVRMNASIRVPAHASTHVPVISIRVLTLPLFA